VTLAFQALLVVFALLPGFLCLYAYSAGINRDAHVSLSLRGVTTRSTAALIAASLLHATWLSLTNYIYAPLQGLEVRFDYIVHLFAGSHGPIKSNALDSVASYPWQITAYFFSLFFVSLTAGQLAQRSIRWLRLDHKSELLRFRNYWHYLLEGEAHLLDLTPDSESTYRKPDVIFVSVTIQMANDIYLYGGFIAKYWLDENYDLSRVLLTAVSRRKLDDDRDQGESRTPQSRIRRYYEIEGHYFLVWMRDVQTLNVEYIYLSYEEDQQLSLLPPSETEFTK
jgi:hypothetical protein